MKAMLTLSLLTALASVPAFADCQAPSNSVIVPDGNSATRDEMVAAQKAIKEFDGQVGDYIGCLQQDFDKSQQDNSLSAGDKQKLTKKFSDLKDAQLAKDKALADKFNTELRVWKAKHPA